MLTYEKNTIICKGLHYALSDKNRGCKSDTKNLVKEQNIMLKQYLIKLI